MELSQEQIRTAIAYADGEKVICNKHMSCQYRKTCNAAKSHQHMYGECGSCHHNIDAKCIFIGGK